MLLYQLSVLLHILSAIIWVGGMFFLALVVVPVARGLPPAERAALFGAVGRRFRAVGWGCIGVLLVTGVVNMSYRGVTLDNVFTAELWASPFGSTLALKVAVVVALLILSAVHDFVLGPRSMRVLERVGHGTPAEQRASAQLAERMRRLASMLGRIEGLLALLVIALAIMLVRGRPF
jgi:putative copper resistance protein D